VLYADYSDPDVIRVGDDYFMVASSFCNVPAIPLLYSRDLVHWRVVNYVLDRLPFPVYDAPAHGKGVWAPAIRRHKGLFYVLFPMPDEGIFCCTATDPLGKWSDPVTVRPGKGWIDPCPFWDEDGKAYMVSAFAKSRTGIKSILNLAPAKPDFSGLLEEGKTIFDGRDTQPTIEGPKMYKRNGWYYILAPAGGVKHGWQTALRAKNIWGPYEEKIVMLRGDTDINGPHQGALVETPSGESWFVHFQDVGAYGRIVHLQPVAWVDDWPVIGDDSGGEGCGTPVSQWRLPDVGSHPPVVPADSDDFDGDTLGLQWQWNANPKPGQFSLGAGCLRLKAMPYTGALCDAPHLLLQKFNAPAFEAVAKMDFRDLPQGGTAGLVVLGRAYGAIAVRKTPAGLALLRIQGAMGAGEDEAVFSETEMDGTLYMKLELSPGMEITFRYSIDGKHYMEAPGRFTAVAGVWVGAKFGLFATGDGGGIGVAYVRVKTSPG